MAPHLQPTRRELFALGAAAMISACRTQRMDEGMAIGHETATTVTADAGAGRLGARPGAPREPSAPGLHPLGLGGSRDGLLYVPAGARGTHPAPLVLMLHGAGGTAEGALGPYRGLADEAGLVLLAPESRRQTWDVIVSRFGPDVAFIDRALAWTFERCAIDPARVAVEGFSDGASYALSLGVANGDLFTHVIAFSPGFLVSPGQEGAPRIFVSHGTDDRVLPVDRCSRRIVPQLRDVGYDVVYREFDGPHTVPPAIAREALDWFLERR